jgi:prevent-host-death family protein
MHIVGAFEAKTHFSSLLDEVEKGGQVVITKHGRAVARLLPMGGSNKEEIREAINAIKEFQKLNSLEGINWRDLRDEGKK